MFIYASILENATIYKWGYACNNCLYDIEITIDYEIKNDMFYSNLFHDVFL